MNSKNEKFSWTGWVVGAGLLLLLSVDLELFVQQTLGHQSVATVILAHYLAFWSCALGLGVLLFFAVWWLAEWGHARVKQVAMSRDASAGQRGSTLKSQNRESLSIIQQWGMAPVAPSRSSRDRDDGNETKSRTKVV